MCNVSEAIDGVADTLITSTKDGFALSGDLESGARSLREKLIARLGVGSFAGSRGTGIGKTNTNHLEKI